MAAKREQKDISSVTLLTVSRTIFQDGQKATEIRVVDWIVGGKHYPQLEKREMFMTDQGEWKSGKAKGFSIKDLEKIQDAWGEIMAALGKKSPESAPAPAMAGAPKTEPATSGPATDF